MPDDRVGLEALEAVLDALASVPRLQILHALREPRTLREIRVVGGGARPISRQAVAQHLRPLLDHGLLARLPGPDRRSGDCFVLDRGMLFAVVDEIRSLARLRPLQSADPRETQASPGPEGPDLGPLPRLLVVYGGEDGMAFPLPAAPGAVRTLGRGAHNDIVLDHDPFVSAQHCRLERVADGLLVQDLGSRNGTGVNFRRLPPGPVVRVAPGDVLTVGRSHLVFQDS